jgi:hypothetical protein
VIEAMLLTTRWGISYRLGQLNRLFGKKPQTDPEQLRGPNP